MNIVQKKRGTATIFKSNDNLPFWFLLKFEINLERQQLNIYGFYISFIKICLKKANYVSMNLSFANAHDTFHVQ